MSEKIYDIPPEWKKRAFIDAAKYQDMYARSVKDPNGFWAEEAKRLNWYKAPTKIKNTSFGPGNVSIKWFEDGVTNAAYRTTPGSGDLRKADFAGSAERLERIALGLAPRAIGFVGKEAYRGAFGERPELGLQERRLGETALFVLPSTSPANAAVPWDERLRWFQAFRDFLR